MIHKFGFFILSAIAIISLTSCAVDDHFSSDTNQGLVFSEDTIRMDTVFTAVPSSARSFWIYNRTSRNLRFGVVLEKGNQLGFRVNINGLYLSAVKGSQIHDVELESNDSIRVFVELTAQKQSQEVISLLEDKLYFMFGNGLKQEVVMQAYSLKADIIDTWIVEEDTEWQSTRPCLVKGGIVVKENATFTIDEGAKFYFASQASLRVDGKILCKGTPQKPIVFRGARLDNIDREIPYDRVSGQWKGISIGHNSYENCMKSVDIHSAKNGIFCDSTEDAQRSKIEIFQSWIHNCDGYGLSANNAKVYIENSIISNAAKNCLAFHGGNVTLNGITVAQFYPFVGGRDKALYISDQSPLHFSMLNSIITGYSDSEVEIVQKKASEENVCKFNNCLLRTKPPTKENDLSHFENNVYEEPKDTIGVGLFQFHGIDLKTLYYNFRLKKEAKAVGLADPKSAPHTDYTGQKRDSLPDIGAYEFIEN